MNLDHDDLSISKYLKTTLPLLENEAIFLIREAAETQKHLGLVFNGGRDSLVLADLVAKAFPREKRKTVPLIYIDVGYNFSEALEVLNEVAERYSFPIVKVNLEKSDVGVHSLAHDPDRLKLQRELLLATIIEHGFDGIYSPARREDKYPQLISMEEEFKSFPIWDPLPERWQPYQTRVVHDCHHRMFPLSNWSEATILTYLDAHDIKLPQIYLAHERVMIERNGELIDLESGAYSLNPREFPSEVSVRAPAIGDILNTSFIPSDSKTHKALIKEILGLKEVGETCLKP